MISCTEFIPSYSELFKYLDERYGYPEVQRFWSYLFKPDGKGIPLVNFVKKDGLRGAVEYWNGTLKEEAADVTRWFNEEEGWAYSEMHYCPSKGRLLKMKEELGVEPYAHYCDHCEYYRPALEMYGLRYYRNSLHVDEARCSSMIFDPKIFKGGMSMNGGTKKIEYRSGDLEYFHRDFHSSMNMAAGSTPGRSKTSVRGALPPSRTRSGIPTKRSTPRRCSRQTVPPTGWTCPSNTVPPSDTCAPRAARSPGGTR